MRKSGRICSKRRARASLTVYSAAALSSFMLSGVSPLVAVDALESTEKLNIENIHIPELQHDYKSSRFDTVKLRSRNHDLRLKGQNDKPSLSQRRDDRQLVTEKEKKTRSKLQAAEIKVKMKTAASASASGWQPNNAAHTMVTKTSVQTMRMKVKNAEKEQMIIARLAKRATKKNQRTNQGDQEKYTPEAEKFLGNLELKWHQQVGGGSSNSDRYDRRSGKPSGGWTNNNRLPGGRGPGGSRHGQRPGGSWPGGQRPGSSRSGGKPRGWKPDGWESGGWKSGGEKPSDRSGGSDWWFSGRDQWSGGSCPCTYVDIDPVESASSWSWSGSSWSWSGSSWGGKMKVCTCEPTYKPTFYPTYYPT